MTTQTNVKTMNDFVLTFLENHAEESVAEWEAEDVQADLKALLTKLRPKVQRAGKKAKDPNRPKRAKSAYLFFCQAMRDTVKESNPEMDAKQITSELGARWNQVKDDEAAIADYVAEAAEDKERYQTAMVDYVPPEPSDDDTVKGRKKKAKKAGPKRSKSSYLFFCQDQRETVKEENPDMDAKQITSELGARWNEIKEDKKKTAKYTKEAEADKERYLEEKENWVEPEGEEAAPAKKTKAKAAPAKAKVTPKGKAAPAKAASKVTPKAAAKVTPKGKVTPAKAAPAKAAPAAKPKGKPALKSKMVTPYNRFCQEQRAQIKEDNPDLKANEVTKELSAIWKDMSEEDKAEYAQE